MSPPSATECNWTIVLAHGAIQVAGLGHDSDAAEALPIVGGTGKYTGASGTMTVTDSTQSTAHYVLRFTTS